MINAISNTIGFNFTELAYKARQNFADFRNYYLSVPVATAAIGLGSYVIDGGLGIGSLLFGNLVSWTAVAVCHLFTAAKQRLYVESFLRKGSENGPVKSLLKSDPRLMHTLVSQTGSTLAESVAIFQIKEILELILQLDPAAANKEDRNQEILLHHVFRYSPDRSSEEIVKMLIPHTRDIDHETRFGETPLSLACANGHFKAAKLLVQSGAQVNKRVGASNAPLLLHGMILGRDEHIGPLLDLGADVNLQDDLGRTPLHLACQLDQNKVAKQLIIHGADLDKKDRNGQTPKDVAGPRTLALLNSQAAQTDSSEWGEA